jgi:hypothetical protein
MKEEEEEAVCQAFACCGSVLQMTQSGVIGRR